MNKRRYKIIANALRFLLCIALYLSALGCKGSYEAAYEHPVVLWTNQSEFAAYAELFNTLSKDIKVLVVYKENPADMFPPAKDEALPDIVVGPWLKNRRIRKNFMPLDYLFDDQLIKRNIFYPQLLKIGSANGKQYLLPVSFNLNAVIFSSDYADLIPNNYMLTPDQIREAAGQLNKKNKNGVYTSMGFAPGWTAEFLYQTAKLYGADFSESSNRRDSFYWNQNALDQVVHYLRDWTQTVNTSTVAENDYKFKYLYNPRIKWVTEKQCLFACMDSNKLFTVPQEKLNGVDYRWIQKDNRLPITDNMISMGMYKYSKNRTAAEIFMIWFMNEENQNAMLEWRFDLNLYTGSFGIAGGFSSIRSVNERIFPVFYPALLGNLPDANYLSTPNILPANWEEIKEVVVLPYLFSAVNTSVKEHPKTMEQFIADWKRRSY